MTARTISEEEAKRLLGEIEDPAPGVGSRAATGAVRGLTLGMVGDVPPESGFSERAQRTIPEAAGATATSMAAVAALAALPGPVGRWARRIVAAGRARPVRTASVGTAGTVGAGVGAAGLPELYEGTNLPNAYQDFAEPIGSVLGGGFTQFGANRIANVGAIKDAGRRVLGFIDDKATNPLIGRTDLPDQGIQREVREALGENVPLTSSQVSQDPGIANIERSMPTDASQAARLQSVREAQSGAALSGVRVSPEGAETFTAPAAIRQAAADKLREAEEASRAAYSALNPNTLVPAGGLIRSSNVIINTADPAIRNTEIPDLARRVVRELENKRLNPRSALKADTLINMRRELDRSLAKPNISESYRESATMMMREIDNALSAGLGDVYSAFRSAEDAMNVAKNSYQSVVRGAGDDIVNRFIDNPVSFRQLVDMHGSSSDAVNSAKQILEGRLIQGVTGSDGIFDPSRARNFVSNRNNMELIEEAFGKDHANRVRAITNVMNRLDTQNLIPRGTDPAGGLPVGRWETIQNRVRRPLDPYSPIGMTRWFAGEAIKVFSRTEKEVLQAMLAESITNPEFLTKLLSGRQAADANQLGQMMSLIGPRLAMPAANSREIQEGLNRPEN